MTTRSNELEQWTAWLTADTADGSTDPSAREVDKPQRPIVDPCPTAPMPTVEVRPARPGIVPPTPDRTGVRRRAARGPRRWAYCATAGLWNPGPSRSEREHDELVGRLQRSPGRRGFRIATLVLKGGVGKTTVSTALAATFGRHVATSPVVLVDGNPQTGTVSKRVGDPSDHDVRDLLTDPLLVRTDQDGHRVPAESGTHSDAGVHTGRSRGRFEVLAGPRSVAAAHGLSREDYELAVQILARFYGIVLTDCGTDLRHEITLATLDLADTVVIVVEPERGAVELAADTLRFLHDYPTDGADEPLLDATGTPIATYRHLVDRAVVVVNQRQAPRHGRGIYDIADLTRAFGTDERRVLVLPYDPHLSTGGEIDLDLLAPATERALLRIAATISDNFAACLGSQ